MVRFILVWHPSRDSVRRHRRLFFTRVEFGEFRFVSFYYKSAFICVTSLAVERAFVLRGFACLFGNAERFVFGGGFQRFQPFVEFTQFFVTFVYERRIFSRDAGVFVCVVGVFVFVFLCGCFGFRGSFRFVLVCDCLRLRRGIVDRLFGRRFLLYGRLAGYRIRRRFFNRLGCRSGLEYADCVLYGL